jgi:hypothetical protein
MIYEIDEYVGKVHNIFERYNFQYSQWRIGGYTWVYTVYPDPCFWIMRITLRKFVYHGYTLTNHLYIMGICKLLIFHHYKAYIIQQQYRIYYYYYIL